MTTTEATAAWARVLDVTLGANGADGRLVITRRRRADGSEPSHEWGAVFYRGVNRRASVKVAALGPDELRAAAETNPEIERRHAASPLLDVAIGQALDRAPGDGKTRSIVLYVEERLAGGGIPF